MDSRYLVFVGLQLGKLEVADGVDVCLKGVDGRRMRHCALEAIAEGVAVVKKSCAHLHDVVDILFMSCT